MEDIVRQIFLGAVQGVAEWLPISSSGHLALFESLFGMRPDLAFDAFLHLGSLVVILIYFRHDIRRLLTSLSFDQRGASDRRFLAYIVLADGITVLTALAIEPWEQELRAFSWLAV